jgi:hypothetical protein
VRADAAVAIAAVVAVRAKDLESASVTAAPQPLKKRRGSADPAAVTPTTAVDVVDRQKERLVGTAAGATVPAVRQDGVVAETIIRRRAEPPCMAWSHLETKKAGTPERQSSPFSISELFRGNGTPSTAMMPSWQKVGLAAMRP